MATLNARASVVGTTTNTVWNTTANAVDGTFGTNNATYCNWTNTAANAVGTIELSFGSQFAAIPAGSIINSVEVTLRHYESQTTRLANVQFQPWDGATAIGSIFTATRATAARSDTNSWTPTLAQLKSATFKIRVTATRFNGTQAGIFYMDYVDVVVDYTTLPVASFTADKTTIFKGESVTFTDTSVDATGWAWTFPTGSPASANTQGPHVITFATAGNHTVTLQASNAAGSNTTTPGTIITVVDAVPIKIFNGTSFKTGSKVWNGVSWRADAQMWDGTKWVPLG